MFSWRVSTNSISKLGNFAVAVVVVARSGDDHGLKIVRDNDAALRNAVRKPFCNYISEAIFFYSRMARSEDLFFKARIPVNITFHFKMKPVTEPTN